MDNDIVIRCRGVVNAFGPNVIHDGLDLDVQKGEVIGVVGASGAGNVRSRRILRGGCGTQVAVPGMNGPVSGIVLNGSRGGGQG